jgi:hypothetical protein
MKEIFTIPKTTVYKTTPQSSIDKDTGIYLNNTSYYFDAPLSNNICNYLLSKNIKTVYEFGCGGGLYTKNMLNHGLDVDSSDGNPNIVEISGGVSYRLDISKKLNLNKRNAVLCLEVGEHVPEKYESVLLDNICNSSDSTIILSWAVEGQGGNGHVNCKNNDYIINQIENRGFIFNNYVTNSLRNNSDLNWFKNTIMVFNK